MNVKPNRPILGCLEWDLCAFHLELLAPLEIFSATSLLYPTSPKFPDADHPLPLPSSLFLAALFQTFLLIASLPCLTPGSPNPHRNPFIPRLHPKPAAVLSCRDAASGSSRSLACLRSDPRKGKINIALACSPNYFCAHGLFPVGFHADAGIGALGLEKTNKPQL